jgi:hypothetical protein
MGGEQGDHAAEQRERLDVIGALFGGEAAVLSLHAQTNRPPGVRVEARALDLRDPRDLRSVWRALDPPV